MNDGLFVRTLLAAAVTLVLLGCSTATPQAPQLNANVGQHPATWTQDHWSAYLKNPQSCTPCHGSTLDPAAAGGTSQVSCFGCHHPNGPHHSTGWAAPAQHGRLGAQLASNGQTGFAGTGFAACTKCHGSDYASPVGITPSCLACHSKAPHPNLPWTSPASGLLVNHDQTDQSNVNECVKCHTLGANSTLKPALPASGVISPGCFNGTLCHDKRI